MSSCRCLPIWLKDSFAIRFRNTRPGIGNSKAHFILSDLGSDRNRPASWSELDGVVDQIRKNLHKAIAVYADRRVSLEVAMDVDGFSLRLHTGDLTDLLRQILSRLFFRIERQLSVALNHGCIDQVLNQSIHAHR